MGEKWVMSDPAELGQFADPYPVGDGTAAPSAVVSPADTEQVQEIVRIANSYGIPLSPISTGKNNGYGGASPALSGAVVVNTGARMNRSWRSTRSTAMRCWSRASPTSTSTSTCRRTRPASCSTAPTSGGAAWSATPWTAASATRPYGDHFMWQTGMEVVLPQGDVMRTGMGAVPGSNTWQLFPYGFGPYPDGMFTQSNLGIVTKMGIALMQRPPASHDLPHHLREESEDLEQIVDMMLPLRINMAPIQNVPVLRNIIMDAAASSPSAPSGTTGRAAARRGRERMQAELGLGYWNFYGTLYGPPPMIEMYSG